MQKKMLIFKIKLLLCSFVQQKRSRLNEFEMLGLGKLVTLDINLLILILLGGRGLQHSTQVAISGRRFDSRCSQKIIFPMLLRFIHGAD